MEDMVLFYVYVHRYETGPMEGNIFYVGKGSGKRAFVKHGRSNLWTRIFNKYGRTSEIIFQSDCEKTAFRVEAITIWKALRCGIVLCNMSNGGEGQSGYAHTIDTRRRMSQSHKGKALSPSHKENLVRMLKSRTPESRMGAKGMVRTPEHKEAISKAHKGKNLSEEMKSHLSELATGRKMCDETKAKIANSMSLKTGHLSHNHDKKKYTITNGVEVLSGMRVELYEKSGLTCEDFSRIVRGKCKTARGWRVIKDD